MRWVAFAIGFVLWLGATALLTEDAWQHGLTVNHCLQPLITAATVAFGIFTHKARWHWRPVFFAMALFGSILTVYGTLGRQAASVDLAENEALRQNRALATMQAELSEAKQGAALECKKLGPR